MILRVANMPFPFSAVSAIVKQAILSLLTQRSKIKKKQG
jgi:hypothetical protein